MGENKPVRVVRCGAFSMCRVCIAEGEAVARVLQESSDYVENTHQEQPGPTDFHVMAQDLIYNYVEEHLPVPKGKTRPDFEVYIVWFCKTIQNWKALLGTTLDDGRYYEVTHNGDKRETYIDEYIKVRNVKVHS
jgi:hypothetical protein